MIRESRAYGLKSESNLKPDASAAAGAEGPNQVTASGESESALRKLQRATVTASTVTGIRAARGTAGAGSDSGAELERLERKRDAGAPDS